MAKNLKYSKKPDSKTREIPEELKVNTKVKAKEDGKEDQKKFSPLKRRILNKDRLRKITKWRKSQKEKIEAKRLKKEEKLRIEKELKERIRIKKIQEKKREEIKLRNHLEAKKLREEHEKKRLELEKEIEEKEKKLEEKTKKKQKEENGEVDPLDYFMLELETNNKNKKKTRKKQTVNKKEIVEIFENETKYEEADLVIKEEVSWLDKMKAKKKEIKPVDHSRMDYKPFRKDFYIESPEITAMDEKDVAEYRAEKLEGVKIRGKDCPRPIFKWSQCGLPDKVYKVLKKFEYSEPFPIQCQAIPCIMAGRDIIACAKTGSGKTLAFIIPMFRHILDQDPLEDGDGPIGLIISPTRELAKQIFAETNKFGVHCGLKTVCCHGGATVADQIGDLKRGPEIIVATPGRMIDMLCVNSGKVTNTRRVTYLVLDEADRMFDMGFEPQIMTIIKNTRPNRQTVLFSATFARQVEGLVREIMIKPIEIVIGGRSVASNEIVQSVKVLKPFEKFNALLKILGENYYKGQILIFTDRQEAVDSLFTQLQQAGYFTLTLHGGMDQFDRTSMITDFKNKTRTILIATSVAARGLDVQDLNLVLNYTVPNHYEDYVHRIGRTGRAGNTGYAITFITPEEEKFAPDLVKALKASNQSDIPVKLLDMASSFRKKVEKGQEKTAPSLRSSGSKGFKFDETEEYQKTLEKNRQSAVYGTSADKTINKNELEERKIAAAEEQMTSKRRRGKAKPMTVLEKQLAAAKAGASAIKTTINVTKTTHSADDVQALAQVAYRSAYIDTHRSETNDLIRSKAEAVAKTLSISQKLRKLGATATPQSLSQAINSNQHCRKFVVNDYPQQARHKATNKESIETVCEFVDVIVKVRGSYFAPGRRPATGEEKLSLFIEGKSKEEVDRAYNEFKRIAEETAQSAAVMPQSYGKYSVL